MSYELKGVFLGRYLLGERVAMGGMGEIRLAVQTGLGEYKKPLVLKLLLPHLASDPQAVKMFLDEARLASGMNHPNVVQIFDVGVENGQYYIAMELVRGVAMSALIRGLIETGKTLSPRALEHVGRSLCEGLFHAHERKGEDLRPLGLVHRDVTPHNVLLSVQGEVKLTDFGIAKARDSSSFTRPGLVKGKYEYLSPEQVSGQSVDHRADIFSAGVTLFQLATLTAPFRRDTDEAVLRAVRLADLPRPETLRKDLPTAFCDALVRATDKDPSRRFASAREFRDAIAPATSSEAADELGALVRELCTDAVATLEKKTEATRHLGTVSVAVDPHEVPREVFERRASLRAGLFGALFMAGVAAVGFAGWRTLSPTEPTAPAKTEVDPQPTPVPLEVAAPPTSESPPPPEPEPSPEPPRLEPPKRPATLAAERAGYLSVDAVPWAKVFVEGKSAGDTPLARYPVKAGWVNVTLENPETGRVAKRRVKVAGGKEAQLKVDLR